MAEAFGEFLSMSLRAFFCEAISFLKETGETATLQKRASRRGIAWVLFLLFFGLTACTPNADVEPLLAPTLAGSLQPYQSPVPSVTPLPPTPAPTETPLPTPTPHLYQIATGDTMGSIALEFGITTNDLIAANPDVPPSSMSVGKEVLIPDEEAILALPTLEPLALELSLPDCYATLSGGMWCFVSVQNGTGAVVESISAEIRLFDEEGSLLASEIAFPLVDRLLGGDALALMAFFADMPANVTANTRLLTAFPASDGDERYLPASLRNVFTEIDWDGSSAEVSGEVFVEGSASQVWVVATAYDVTGKVVGARRWESASGESMFYLTVASLGYAIERVELLVEAKP